MRRLLNRLRAWLWSFRRDNCEVCLGESGGVLGNENLIPTRDGWIVMCDYCTARFAGAQRAADRRGPQCAFCGSRQPHDCGAMV